MNFKHIILLAGLVAVSIPACKSQVLAVKDREVLPAISAPCFPGAYYRKAATSFDTWTGITGVVTLGYPKVDEHRLDTKTGQPLDNFSVYMGGSAGGHEVDAGLTWEFSTDSQGNISKRRNAWRPFWRTNNWNSAPNKPEYIWQPGDQVEMTVMMIAPQKLRMIIADTRHPEKKFQVDFDAPGFTYTNTRQFKRVNAIDQSHNEGKPVQPTKAQVTGAEWLNTTLFRGVSHTRLPMNTSRFTDIRCSDASHIVVSTTDPATGAEKIDIYGTAP